MFTGFSNIFKNINERQKICKSLTMATQDSYHGALQNFHFSLPPFPFYLFVSSFTELDSLLIFMFMKEHLYFDMSVEIIKFLKKKMKF